MIGKSTISMAMFNSYVSLPEGNIFCGNYGKSPFLISKSTISMAMFNSYVSLPEGNIFFVETMENHHF